MTHEFDVVIVGAGGAGLRAAVELPDGISCAVLTKVFPTRSHTGAAQGGVCAALANEEEDSWDWHAFDTVKGSDYLGDQDAIDIMCQDAIRAIIELEHMGMPFSRTPEGKIAQRKFGGHTREYGKEPVRRACYSADRTGHVMLHTLYETALKRHVNFFSEFFVTDLMVKDGTCCGVVGLNIMDGEVHTFRAKAVMFATGGYGRAFRITSNAHVGTGDGSNIAWERGVPLQDMEFIQFHPTGLWRLGVLISEAARGEGGILLNNEGVRFMEQVAPTVKDLAPRDMVSRAIFDEIAAGRGFTGHDGSKYIHLDLSHLGADVINSKLPEVTGFARTYLGIEPLTEPIPVHPTTHYAMGGIPTDVDGRVIIDSKKTAMPGFFAAGECACVSVHGANRLGTNSLLDIVVFGRRTGKSISEFLKGASFADLPGNPEEKTRARMDKLKNGSGSERVGDIRLELQDVMMENISVYREDAGIKKAIEAVRELKDRYEECTIDDKGHIFNTDLYEGIELGNLIGSALATAESALVRTESRGAHFRTDYPDRDDKDWLKHTLIHQSESGETSFDYKDVTLGRFEPKPRVY